MFDGSPSHSIGPDTTSNPRMMIILRASMALQMTSVNLISPNVWTSPLKTIALSSVTIIV